MTEIWKDIKGWEGKYQVSNFGRVKSFYGKRETILTPVHNMQSLRVGLSNYRTKVLKTVKVHRLVAMAFLPNPENKPVINHIDNNYTNNHVGNLEWCTQTENIAHCVKQNRQGNGEKARHSKLTENDVKVIRTRVKNGEPQKKLALEYGLNPSNISLIINKKSWKHI